MIIVHLYTRKDCHLCDDVAEDLASLRGQYPHELIKVDIDSDPALRERFGEKIPVVKIGPYQLQAPINRQRLAISLGAASDRENQDNQIERFRSEARHNQPEFLSGSDKTAYFITRHYLAIFNLFFLLYVGLPFLAPTFARAGIEAPARILYNSYSLMCHQLAFRSLFLFGEQSFYPREAAGVTGLQTYEQVTGYNTEDLITARSFWGNQQMGYKVALCQRDIAIYVGIFLFGVIYAATGRRLPPLAWYFWGVLGIMPMGLDGFSQLISQLPVDWMQSLLPYRESTPFLRTLTGLLFGICTAWFGYPLAEASMRDARKVIGEKMERVRTKNKGTSITH